MSLLLTRLDELSSPIVEHIAKYAGVADQQVKLGVGVLGAGLGAAALWKMFGSSRYNLPPGPKPLPVIGNLHNMGSSPKIYMVLDGLKEKYGDIVTFYMGPYRTIMLSNADLLRQAFIKDGLVYADRQTFASMDIMTDGGKDIIGAQYDARLQQQRKVAHAAIRKYASGDALEHHVQFAFEAMCEEIDKAGKFVPIDMGYLVAYNILASMCFGRKFDFDDPFMKEMMGIQVRLEETLNSPLTLLFLMSFMKHFPSPQLQTFKDIRKAYDKFLGDCLASHMETYDPEKLTDFTYHMIHIWKTEAQNNETERSKMSLLEKEHFVFILFDMFFAGTDTTRATFAWIWQYLAAFPEVQDKAQKEIDDIIGDEQVTVDCRDRLPYVDAVLHEVMRLRPVAATGVARLAREDAKLNGYDIPAGTMVMHNTWGIHHDPRNWPDPEAFLPERWLDENGQYVFQQNGFVPFGVGRRSCIGESFAKLELHMLTTLLLQRFTLKPAPGRRIDLNTIPAVSVRAKDQDIYVEKRKK